MNGSTVYLNRFFCTLDMAVKGKKVTSQEPPEYFLTLMHYSNIVESGFRNIFIYNSIVFIDWCNKCEQNNLRETVIISN